MLIPWVSGPSQIESAGFVAASTRGTRCTSHASAPLTTDGAWNELIAATTDDYHAVWVCAKTGGSPQARALVDFGIGAGGVEEVLIPDIQINNVARAAGSAVISALVPIYVPKSSRITARVHRATVNSTIADVQIMGVTYPAGFSVPSYHRITPYGVVLASGSGTLIDPGAVTGTLGTVQQVVSSTTNPIQVMMVQFTEFSVGNWTTNAYNTVQIYEGSSNIIVPEYQAWVTNATSDYPCNSGPYFWPVCLPAGSDIRAASRPGTAASAGQREGSIIIWGFD